MNFVPEGGDTLCNFVARNSCMQQIAQCVIRILLRAIDSWSILGNMLRTTNVVACNRYLLCHTLQFVAYNFVALL